MITFKQLQEKAVSQQQQKLMGLALAYKRGEVPEDEVSATVKGLADRMSEKDLEDFASTKHKGLPKKADESLWANIHKKRKEGRPMRKPGAKGAPTAAAFKQARGEEVDEVLGAVKRIAQNVKDRFGPKKNSTDDKMKQRDQARKEAEKRIALRRKEAEKRVRQRYKDSNKK